MKKLGSFIVVVLGLVVVSLGGCNPCKRLALKCPSHDSTITTIETIRDTIWVHTPADTLMVAVPMKVIEELGELGLTVESNDQEIEIRIIHDTLFVDSKCKEDSLQAIVDSQRTTIENTKTIYIDVPGPEVEVKHNGKFARFAMFFFILVVILFGVWIYTKIRSGAIKTVLKQFPNPFKTG